MNTKSKQQYKQLRHRRVRAKIFGTSGRPRIAVFKSNQYIYAQVIDDISNKTLLSASDMEIKSGKKSNKAGQVGKNLAEEMKKKGLTEAIFDRGGFKFHGRVKSVADGLRSGGIKL